MCVGWVKLPISCRCPKKGVALNHHPFQMGIFQCTTTMAMGYLHGYGSSYIWRDHHPFTIHSPPIHHPFTIHSPLQVESAPGQLLGWLVQRLGGEALCASTGGSLELETWWCFTNVNTYATYTIRTTIYIYIHIHIYIYICLVYIYIYICIYTPRELVNWL